MTMTDSAANKASQVPKCRMSLSVFLATGFGIGFIPWAPGTFGSLLGLPLAWAIAQIPSVAVQLGVILAFCLIGVPIATRAVRRLRAVAEARGDALSLKKLQDPGCIVIDEIAGVTITLFLAPVHLWPVLVAGFVLFRIFDISKLPPVSWAEKFPEGIGIQADDCVAGLYAWFCLQLLLYFKLLPGVIG